MPWRIALGGRDLSYETQLHQTITHLALKCMFAPCGGSIHQLHLIAEVVAGVQLYVQYSVAMWYLLKDFKG